jgi:hypothetical protein
MWLIAPTPPAVITAALGITTTAITAWLLLGIIPWGVIITPGSLLLLLLLETTTIPAPASASASASATAIIISVSAPC